MSKIIDSYSESNASSNWYGIDGSGGLGRYPKTGQSFTGDGKTLDSCKFYLFGYGSPTGNAVAKIYAHTGTFGVDGLPTGSPLATSDNFDVSTLSGSDTLETFNFTGANKIKLENGTKYFVMLEFDGGDASNSIFMSVDATSPTHSGNPAKYLSSWFAIPQHDIIFYVYGTFIMFVNKSRESTSLTNKTKNSTPLTNKAKVSTSFTNRAK